MTRLEEIAEAIRTGNHALARDLLRSEIRENPSAEAWFLASQVASSPEQTIDFLEKALQLDPFHNRAHEMLTALRPRQTPLTPTREGYVQSGVSSPVSSPTVMSGLLDQAVLIFSQHGWNIKYTTAQTAQFEKRKGANVWLAVGLIALGGLLGSLIVMAIIAANKTERVTFRLNTNGSLTGTIPHGEYPFEERRQLTMLAESVHKGMTSYAGTLALGVFSSFISYLIFYT